MLLQYPKNSIQTVTRLLLHQKSIVIKGSWNVHDEIFVKGIISTLMSSNAIVKSKNISQQRLLQDPKNVLNDAILFSIKFYQRLFQYSKRPSTYKYDLVSSNAFTTLNKICLEMIHFKVGRRDLHHGSGCFKESRFTSY